MNYCLVLAFMCACACAAPAPGMRGGGASGATKNEDPSNPNLQRPSGGASANGFADGNNSKVYTFVEKRNGHHSAFAHSSSMGGKGNAVANAQAASSSS